MESVYSVIDQALEQIYALGKYAEPTVVLGKDLHEKCLHLLSL